MKKITIVSIFSLVFLGICSIVADGLKHLNLDNEWQLLLTGIAILVISGVANFIVRKNRYVDMVCFLANAIALGFCIRAWYVFREFDNSLTTILLVSLACLAYLLVFYAILYIPFIEKHFEAYLIVFLMVTLIVYGVVICTTETTFVSTFGYYVIIEVAFIFAMCNHADTLDELFRNITLSTYSVLVVAIIIALLMLCEDGVDGIDVSGDLSIDISSPKDDEVKKDKEHYW